jgi:hypothetical protein
MERDVRDIKEVASLFGESRDVWWKRCQKGAVPGAFKQGERWFVEMNTYWKDKLGEVADA